MTKAAFAPVAAAFAAVKPVFTTLASIGTLATSAAGFFDGKPKVPDAPQIAFPEQKVLPNTDPQTAEFAQRRKIALGKKPGRQANINLANAGDTTLGGGFA